MQNVTITIDGVTKKYEPIDVHNAYLNRDLSIKNKWYREIEEVEPDHQIISFKDTEGRSWLISKDGEYTNYLYPQAKYFLHQFLQYIRDGRDITIESVSRLSDHQVFTVGNGMNYNKDGTCYVIENFILRDGKIYINGHETDKTIEDWILYVEPPVIVTTEDGVKITDEEQVVYGINNQFDRHSSKAFYVTDSDYKTKYFSTPEARDEYILYNKSIMVTYKELTENTGSIKNFFKSKIIKPEFPNDHIG